MELGTFKLYWLVAVVAIATIVGGVLYVYFKIDHYSPEIIETPAGGLIDPETLPRYIHGLDDDPVSVGINNEIWGPLYPTKKERRHVRLDGLPFNYPPLSEDIKRNNKIDLY